MDCCRIGGYLVILLLTVAAEGDHSDSDAFTSASVYCKEKKCELSIGKLDWKSATAVATFNDTLLATGWGILDVSSGYNDKPTQDDEDILFAAGFLEGALTAQHMESQYTNLYKIFFAKPNPVLLGKLEKWFLMQRSWADKMIDQHSGNSPFWRHVSYILAQLDGLLAGYQSVQQSDKVALDLFAMNILQGNGDMFDLVALLDPKSATDWKNLSPSEARRFFYSMGHCSALIKVLPGYENIIMSHSSWFNYQATNRIYKHYNFNVKDTATAAKKLSFSSYAGYLESLDDFYLLSSGMVMLQTTNSIFNTTLYSELTPNSLLAWQRIRVANMMAHNGSEWVATMAKCNSGTYNNQYMVIDVKKVKPKEPLPDGTLYVAEQIPGLVVTEDLTSILREGYFASFNIPYFKDIFNKSGYPDYVKLYGPDFTHDLAPRAKIFRRDEGRVNDLESMKNIMRYNDYQHDAYSEDSPWNAICSRGDLDPGSPRPDGCYDTKVTDLFMAKDLKADVINGPTLGTGLKPFSWTGVFQDMSHIGLPSTYNFSFIRTQPSLEKP